ncbi:hypothetical protein ASF49_15650 [Methylobacterium sp. Leaf104]|jgi:3',5'-cyclic AMP phosphodiesterase CpdA|uniref:metallophosphoesterase n=1 Tax=Methylobacterium TaxID=407 RepID=UPI0006FD80FC|nr:MULTISPECIES: metallophosphoesterase [Methylobacterium]KQO42449.1 hypothetical protein ASF08_12630 [Methylobacterium sp. Leaf85]KQP29593.1 hypothetical protein ASF49_15650 [Methylobacterium sp. Leaf104]KQQ24208.1 hypothetical protein ASF58_16645 [Methylobacterium sp. Leaf125]MCI9881863.1 metallophosphoesterase [Methylobacterium goesingense]
MTRAWIFSDVHDDADCWEAPAVPVCDVAIVAGDVADGLTKRSLPWLAACVAPYVRHVVYVPGNHDFYGSRWQSELERGREAAAAAGIHLLAVGEVLAIEGVRIIGATVWTDYALLGEAWRAPTMASCGDRNGGMRDHRKVKVRTASGETNAFRPSAAAAEHVAQLGRIERALAETWDGPTVVVTHHAPHPASLGRQGPLQAIDAAYATDLTRVLEGPDAPALWIHGHIHRSADYVVGGTRVLANPRGRHGENPAFDPALIVEI